MGQTFYFVNLKDCLDVDRDNFDCDDPEINNYIKDVAIVAQETNHATTFLMLDKEERKIAGFYTLSSSVIPRQDLPDEYRESKLPYATPAILIGQFALDKTYQKCNLSKYLLGNAYRRIFLLYKQSIVAFRAIRVDTRAEKAKKFWIRQGFIEFKKNQSSLFLPINTVIKTLEGNE